MTTRAFLDRLAPEAWARLAVHGEVVRLDATATVLRRGDPPQWLLVVETGALVAVDPRTTPPTVLARMGPGHVVGEMAFLDRAPVSAEVRAEVVTVCRRFQVTALADRLRADPPLDAAFHAALAGTLGGRIRDFTTSAMTGALGVRDDRTTGAVDLRDVDGADPHLVSLLRAQGRPERSVALSGDRVTLGTDPGCTVRIPDAHLAPVHAELVRTEVGWRVVSLAPRAVVVDGVPVRSAPVPDGTELQLGRARVRVDRASATVTLPGPVFGLHAEDVGRSVGGRALLRGVSVSVLSGEVVALVGPSGAGKTTLLGALAGTARPDSGRVRLDGEDLLAVLARVPTVVGEVPQDDVVSPELTVEESLRYAARLRVPQASAAAREGLVNRVLRDLGLDAVRGSRIGDPEERGISGGQRKRVNLAPELLADTGRVLFLDEPTSGLDPRSAEDVARLARRLADDGRVVVIVTHDLTDAVLAQVDHLLVMAPGGFLAWFGPVADAPAFFGATSPARLFERLPDHTGAEWAARYAASAAADRWVRDRRRLADTELRTTPLPPSSPIPSWPSQWATLTARSARVKGRDATAVAILGLQPLVVALVVLLVFPHATAGLLFLLVLASLWFGMSAAVRELIADRTVWRRERRVGIAPSAWVLSKATVLAAAVALQCATIALVAYLAVGLGPLGFDPVGLTAVLVATGWVGVALGLAVSAVWRRADAAIGTIVLLLVPQITFAGILTPLDQVTGPARALSWLVPLRYAFHLALSQGDSLEYLKLGAWHRRPVSGELFLMGLRPAGEGSLGLPASVLSFALVGFALAALVVAIHRTGARR